MRRRLSIFAALLTLTGLLLVAVPFVRAAQAEPSPEATTSCDGQRWVAAWTAAPQSSSLGRSDELDNGLADGVARTFDDQSVRMIVSPHTAGSALRVHLGNRYGTTPITIDATTVGVRSVGAALVPGSLRNVTFSGARSVSIRPGEEAVSDPLDGAVVPFADLAVSAHLAGSAPLDYHQWAQSTNYVTAAGSGDHVSDEGSDAYAEQLTSSYLVAGVDVLAPRSTGVVVTLGDSITDGVGSTPDTNQRWPDDLAHRAIAGGTSLSIVNAGIAGNHVATSGLTTTVAIGPSAAQRVARDALTRTGVTDLFLFEGINDIFKAEPGVDVAAKVIDGYRTIIRRAHAAGVRVTASTITPAAMTGEKEAARQAVNAWIRTSQTIDHVVDFDAVVRDPADPTKVRPEVDAAMAHLTDAGYRELAAAIDLDSFQGTGCGV